MTLAEAESNIGAAVVYRPHGGSWATAQRGVITATTSRYVFVRYGTDEHAKATYPTDLTFVGDES